MYGTKRNTDDADASASHWKFQEPSNNDQTISNNQPSIFKWFDEAHHLEFAEGHVLEHEICDLEFVCILYFGAWSFQCAALAW